MKSKQNTVKHNSLNDFIKLYSYILIYRNKTIHLVVFDYIWFIFYNSIHHSGDISPESKMFKVTQLLTPTHAHFHWIKFIKNIQKTPTCFEYYSNPAAPNLQHTTN